MNIDLSAAVENKKKVTTSSPPPSSNSPSFSVDIVRLKHYVVIGLSDGSLFMNLLTGSFSFVYSNAVSAARFIAEGVSPALVDLDPEFAGGLPRYVVRERLRSLQQQLEAPFELQFRHEVRTKTPMLRFGGRWTPSSTELDVTKLVLKGSSVRTPIGLFLLVGSEGEGKRTIAEGFAQNQYQQMVSAQRISLPWRLGQRRFDAPLVHMWFVSSGRRRGENIVLARRRASDALIELMRHVVPPTQHGFVEAIRASVVLVQSVPAYEVTVPLGAEACLKAVSDYAVGLGLLGSK